MSEHVPSSGSLVQLSGLSPARARVVDALLRDPEGWDFHHAGELQLHLACSRFEWPAADAWRQSCGETGQRPDLWSSEFLATPPCPDDADLQRVSDLIERTSVDERAALRAAVFPMCAADLARESGLAESRIDVIFRRLVAKDVGARVLTGNRRALALDANGLEQIRERWRLGPTQDYEELQQRICDLPRSIDLSGDLDRFGYVLYYWSYAAYLTTASVRDWAAHCLDAAHLLLLTATAEADRSRVLAASRHLGARVHVHTRADGAVLPVCAARAGTLRNPRLDQLPPYYPGCRCTSALEPPA